MKTIKLILFGFLILFIVSCQDQTCTSFYGVSIKVDKVDGEKDGTVSIKYIGPKEYEKHFNFKLNNEIPYYKSSNVITLCKTTDFKKAHYDFLEITNTSSADIYICTVIGGEESPTTGKTFNKIGDLLRIYNEQDKDPNYDYKKDPRYKKLDYLSREDLYKKLFEEKYPYIIKLAPKKTCIMKWGGYGFHL